MRKKYSGSQVRKRKENFNLKYTLKFPNEKWKFKQRLRKNPEVYFKNVTTKKAACVRIIL